MVDKVTSLAVGYVCLNATVLVSEQRGEQNSKRKLADDRNPRRITTIHCQFRLAVMAEEEPTCAGIMQVLGTRALFPIYVKRKSFVASYNHNNDPNSSNGQVLPPPPAKKSLTDTLTFIDVHTSPPPPSTSSSNDDALAESENQLVTVKNEMDVDDYDCEDCNSSPSGSNWNGIRTTPVTDLFDVVLRFESEDGCFGVPDHFHQILLSICMISQENIGHRVFVVFMSVSLIHSSVAMRVLSIQKQRLLLPANVCRWPQNPPPLSLLVNRLT
ncbi:hypothetical protein D917_06362 [Trichinella nativa]|uniref:Uncharacterized protein n=1 Tax=Trichinella nativa TaxID=6335 RepID=A0A1Y3EYP4_9BILA|nr:hypothetical protein D917_06362 [Trichinella nativa]